MKRSTSKILTTHTGSLPRTSSVQDLLLTRQERRQLDQNLFASGVDEAVAEVVAHQSEIGVDVINDGEQGRAQYATYVQDRLTGFDGELLNRARPRLDDLDFPEFAAVRNTGSATIPQPACTGPITWKDWPAVQKDIERLKAATIQSESQDMAAEVFMTAASPGVIANFLPNEYYPTEEAYLYALADVMKDEYKAITSAGLLLQIDCPDLAMTRVSQFSDLTLEEFPISNVAIDHRI